MPRQAEHTNGKGTNKPNGVANRRALVKAARVHQVPNRGHKYAYDPSFPNMVFNLRLLGATDEQIADACQVTSQTLWNWVHGPNKVPEFAEAHIEGGIRADAKVVRSLYQRTQDHWYDDIKVVVTQNGIIEVPIKRLVPGEVTAQTKWLFNRQPKLWRDRTVQEHTGPDGKDLLPPTLVLKALEGPKDTK